METFIQDLRFGLRQLIKNPIFTFIAVLTLALGIGANTAVFSVINGILFKTLPYQDPDRITFVWSSNTKAGFPQVSVIPINYVNWEKNNKSFEYIAARRNANFNLVEGEEPERILGETVSYNYFNVMGVKPVMGRFILPEEDKPGGEKVVVLREGYWQNRFAGNTNIIGRKLTINNQPFTVIGIAPNDHRTNVDLWVPLALEPEKEIRGMHNIQVLARLRPGVAISSAQAEMDTLAEQDIKQDFEINSGWSIKLVPMYEMIVQQIRPTLWILFGSVGFVLLIACANVVNLLLVRSVAREREIAIRIALGASKIRLIRQFLTESVLLSLIGGLLGLLIAQWGTSGLVALATNTIPRAQEIGIDKGVLIFTLAISCGVGIILGLIAAMQKMNLNLNEILKDHGTNSSSSSRSRRIHSVLVVSELALALVLLVGAGLLIRSFLQLQRVNPGFNPDNVLTMQMAIPGAKYPKEEQQAAFFKNLTQQVSQIPGVESVAINTNMPLSGGSPRILFTVEGKPLPPSEAPTANIRWISPDYFKVMSIPLLQGRYFSDQDDAKMPRVAIINKNMANAMFPGEDPIGKRVSLGAPDGNEEVVWIQIVGVVGDVKFSSLSDEYGMEMYWAFAQEPKLFATLTVKTKVDPTSITSAIRKELLLLDRSQPVFNTKTLNEVVAASLSQARFTMILLAIFAVIALLLSTVGIYGVISYSVSQRTQEIGIRMALGADDSAVLGMILKQTAKLIVIGLGIGLIGAFLLTRVIEGMLFGVSATDPLTFTGISLLLGTVALIAGFIPARRATKVDPMIALRCQ